MRKSLVNEQFYLGFIVLVALSQDEKKCGALESVGRCRLFKDTSDACNLFDFLFIIMDLEFMRGWIEI